MKNIFFVECSPDELFIQKIGIPKKNIVHAYSKGRVCKRLSKSTHGVGVVDEDPGSPQPRYLRNMKILENSQKHSFKILFDEKRNNYMVVISPRLEEWIIEASKESKINMGKYNLPENGYRLHRVINSELTKFEKLLNKLIYKSERIDTLKKYIRRFLER